MEEKLSSPPRHSVLACRARLPDTLRGDPCGSEASPALHRHRGGPNFKNAPAVTRAEVCTDSQRRLAQWERKSRGGRGLLDIGRAHVLTPVTDALGFPLSCRTTKYTPRRPVRFGSLPC